MNRKIKFKFKLSFGFYATGYVDATGIGPTPPSGISAQQKSLIVYNIYSLVQY